MTQAKSTVSPKGERRQASEEGGEESSQGQQDQLRAPQNEKTQHSAVAAGATYPFGRFLINRS